MEKKKLSFEVSKEIEGKFEVINTDLPILFCKIGKIDFRTITIAEAEEVVKLGTMYLRKIDPPKSGKSA